MIPQRALFFLVAGVLILPIAMVLMLAVRGVLVAMGDAAGGMALDRVNLGVGMIWALLLVVLIAGLGINSLGPPTSKGGGTKEAE